MNILVCLDSNYIKPLKVMLKSLFLNNPDQTFTIYLMHSSISEQELSDLRTFIASLAHTLEEILITESYFADSPTLLHYTKEMYYRLLAHKFLPQDLDRILYLDPDILVINSIAELYNIDLEGHLYAAAYHDKIAVKEINRIRFYPYEIKHYYNSGVLLMDLVALRQEVNEQAIFDFVDKNRSKLIMPDQDVLNVLYAKRIRPMDEKYYNYDTRYYRYYRTMTGREWNMHHVIHHTVILHFCGKKKPWHENYSGEFHALYKQYEKLAFQ